MSPTIVTYFPCEAMAAHVLVRWPNDAKWDVYPLRSVKSAELQCRLSDNPKSAKELKEPIEIEWEDGKVAAAFILAVGTAIAMERKRTKLVQAEGLASARPMEVPRSEHPLEPVEVSTTDKRKCSCGGAQDLEDVLELVKSLEGKLEAAGQKIKRLKQERNEARQMLDVPKLVKKLVKATSAPPAATLMAPQVDIGDGVLVPQSLLARIKSSAALQPTRFARDLLRAVFTAEELAGSSLHGRTCNAQKQAAAKKALDPRRLQAVLSFTCSEFGVSEKEISGSLSSMLARGQVAK